MATSSQHGLKKAIEALKDSTKVGLAIVNGDHKGLDVAIVKATNHEEVIPKEKHVRTILLALSASSPRYDHVAFCIHALFKRLAKTRTWTVALKTLIVIHRAMRVDPSFLRELVNLRDRSLMLNLAHFRDDSSPQAWNYSAWIRVYALYIEERLECFHVLKYDVNRDQSRNRRLDVPHLLQQLPVLQELLYRLLYCKPEGAALHNHLIHYVLSIIAEESVKLYIAISDGILNLVDKYFEMQRNHAVKALEIYRKAGKQASQLSEFFEICRGLHYGRGQTYLKIKPLPESFLTAMEEYVKEAPEILALPYTIEDDQAAARVEIPPPETGSLIDHNQDTDVQEETTRSGTSQSDPSQAVAKLEIGDLLCFDDPNEEGSELDEKNSLALAIVEAENPSNTGNDVNSASAATGWELELFSAPISNGAAAENKLIGELDRVTLDSLYDQAVARTTNQEGTYNLGQASGNPFEADYNQVTTYQEGAYNLCQVPGNLFEADYNQDPFYGSSSVTPQTDALVAAMAQQQTYIMQQQQLAYMMRQQQQPPPMAMDAYVSTNPSGNPFLEQLMPSHPTETSSRP
ncbi:hypothetical protein PTKIN_Ptkin19aG0020800 [Pterospermum kingtungense]